MPHYEKTIDVGYCDKIQGIADGFYKQTADEEHLGKDDYMLCKGCKMRGSLWERTEKKVTD